MARTFTVCLVILLAIFELGYCTICYQCNSQSDSFCTETLLTPGNLTYADCQSMDSIRYNQIYLYNFLPLEVFGSVVGVPRYCHKIVTESGTVIRTCLDGNLSDVNLTCRALKTLSQHESSKKKIKHCSACDTNNCNA